jgi:LmbE family N-acetylglucosaminyl deacetylase
MSEHEATSLLVRDACFAAPLPNYRTGAEDAAPAVPAIPHLYFVNPLAGTESEFYIDIRATFAIKRAMLAEHDSQRSWLAKHHGIDDYLDQMERWTRETGRAQERARGIWQYKGHPYPRPRSCGFLHAIPL